MDGKHSITQTEPKTLGLGSPGFCVETPDMWPVRFEGKMEEREGTPQWGLGASSSLVSGVTGDLRQAFLLSVALGISSLTLGTGEGRLCPRQDPDTQQDSLCSLFNLPSPHPWLTWPTPARDMVWVLLSWRLFSQNLQTLTTPAPITEGLCFLGVLS